MELDLAEVHERWSYLVGHYYECHTQQLLSELLRPGDSFVDVGANIGHLTLTAARCVGIAGRVWSFEPNPHVCARLRAHIAMNDLGEIVRVHNVALADKPGLLRLSVPVEGSGGATLGRLGSEYCGSVADLLEVSVAIGDDLCQDVEGASAIKVDVEGFEAFVIEGLSRTIARNRPALIVEAWPEHLLNAGSSIEALFSLRGITGIGSTQFTAVRSAHGVGGEIGPAAASRQPRRRTNRRHSVATPGRRAHGSREAANRGMTLAAMPRAPGGLLERLS